MPKVSVIIPTHNRPSILKRAIDSILKQTFQDFEIIVVDDGTKERATNTIESFHDSRIIYIQHEFSRGAPAARNMGLVHAKGEYIALLDDDDEAFPRRLELQVRALDEHPDVGLVYTSLELVGKGRKIEKWMDQPLTPKALREEVLRHNFLFNTTLMLRRSCLEGTTFFDESFPKNQEWDLVIRLMDRTKFLAIPDMLVRAHILGDSEHLGGLSNMSNIIRANKMLVEKHAAQYAKYPRALAYLYFSTAILERDYGNFSDARRDFLKAWKLAPFSVLYARNYFGVLLGKSVLQFLKEFKRYGLTKLTDTMRVFIQRLYRAGKRTPLLGGIMSAGKSVYQALLGGLMEKYRVILNVKRVISTLYEGDTRVMIAAKHYVREFEKKGLFELPRSVIGPMGDFDVLLLYVLTRLRSPKIFLETGVASGRSSRVILEALTMNGEGELYSIDLPKYFDSKGPAPIIAGRHVEVEAFISSDKSPGWLVPDRLRGRWHLLLGDTKELLPKTLTSLGAVNAFLHDSDHSYENMMFEFEAAWPKILPGGFLVSDDVKWNDAFIDFANKNNIKDYSISSGFGVINKSF